MSEGGMPPSVPPVLPSSSSSSSLLVALWVIQFMLTSAIYAGVVQPRITQAGTMAFGPAASTSEGKEVKCCELGRTRMRAVLHRHQ